MSRETIIMVIAQECFPDSPDGHGGYDGLLHAERIYDRILPLMRTDADGLNPYGTHNSREQRAREAWNGGFAAARADGDKHWNDLISKLHIALGVPGEGLSADELVALIVGRAAHGESRARVTKVGSVTADQDGVILSDWGFDARRSFVPALNYTGPEWLVCGWTIREPEFTREKADALRREKVLPPARERGTTR